jgi:hypothetical protein
MFFVIPDAASHPVSATWGGQSVPDYAVLTGSGLMPVRSADTATIGP